MTAAGAAGLVGLRPTSAAAEPPPETTTIRLYHQPIACLELAEAEMAVRDFGVHPHLQR